MSEPEPAAAGEPPVPPAQGQTTPGDRAFAPHDPAFDAQMMAQDSGRRGLRGGRPALDEARRTYLETEWSGPSDRRTPAGAQRRERV